MENIIKPEEFNDYRDLLANYEEMKQQNTTSPMLYNNERAAIIGLRAQQLTLGCVPLIKIEPGIDNVIHIAEKELEQRKIPFIIKRTIASKFEYWKLEDMIY